MFYDLGCGTGKALFIAALCFPFAKCVGIELLEGLCEQAVACKEGAARYEAHADAGVQA